MVTEQAIIHALGKVIEPELHKDLISLKMIKDLVVDNSTVRFTVVLTTPACPLKADIKAQCEQAVKEVPGVDTVEINFAANVSQRKIQPEKDLIPHVKNVVAIGSGKGGVGKSTIAVNLAVSLAKAGANVGLLDADVYGPNVPMMTGIRHRLGSKEHRIIPAQAYDVKVVSLGCLVPEDEPVIWRGPMIHHAVRQYLRDVEWGILDYLVVDLPPGTGDAPLSLAQLLPLVTAVIVTTPQKAAVRVAMKALMMYQKMDVSVLGIVENMAYFICPRCRVRTDIFSSGLGEQAAKKHGVPFLGRIPIHPAIRIGSDKGTPIVIADPTSAEGWAFMEIASKVAARISMINADIDFDQKTA